MKLPFVLIYESGAFTSRRYPNEPILAPNRSALSPLDPGRGHGPSSDAHMVTRFGSTPGAPFFVDLVNGESIAIGLMLDFATALRRSEADLQAYEPQPRGQTYPSYAASLGFYATDADIAAAYLVNFPVFGENTARMNAALQNRYGFTAQQTAFFDFFSSLPPTFEPQALAIIERGLDSGSADARSIKRAARLLQAYELDFWDAVAAN